MSDIAQGPGWWLASDGKWYPPRDESQAPSPGWWLASDGKWYPPMESDEPPEVDWWLASDGRWYPPDRKPGARPAPATTSTDVRDWPPPDPAQAVRPSAGPAERPAPEQPAPAATDRPGPAERSTPHRPAAERPSAPEPSTSIAHPVAAERPPASAHPAGSPGDPSTPSRSAEAEADRIAGRPPVKPIPAPGTPRPSGPARERPVKPIRADQPRPAAPTDPRPDTPAERPAASAVPHERRGPTAPTGARPAGGRGGRSSDLDHQPANGGHAESGGVSPQDQMRARDEQSRRDAVVLADARRQAAMRALGSLGVLAERAAPPAERVDPAPGPGPSPAGGAPIEVTPSQLLVDGERMGDRLIVDADSIELRDRRHGVLRRLSASQVAGVAVEKKFTGTALTIHTVEGVQVVARGLKPDQADQIRARLEPTPGRPDRAEQTPPSRSTEPPATAGPETESRTGPTTEQADPAGQDAPEERPDPADPPMATMAAVGVEADLETTGPADAGTDRSEVHLDEADLVAKLAALRDAGVLTDAEYHEKAELVARLARGDLAVSSAPAH